VGKAVGGQGELGGQGWVGGAQLQCLSRGLPGYRDIALLLCGALLNDGDARCRQATV
jgi:hypothetical protein